MRRFCLVIMSGLARLARSRAGRVVGGAVLALVVAVLVTALRIGTRAAPYIASEPAGLPRTDVALVLGCSPLTVEGRRNLFFERRIRAAAELYRAGRVAHLIVSGDNGEVSYDEPSAMKRALVEAGVPPERITRDFAGFRTLDSVLRARDVFGVRRLTVVSQRFHVERAIYLARAHGMEAFALAARDVGGPEGTRVKLRELASRVVAVLDVHLLHSRPRFTGPPIPLPPAP